MTVLEARIEFGDESARAELATEKAINAKLRLDAKAAEQASKLTPIPLSF